MDPFRYQSLPEHFPCGPCPPSLPSTRTKCLKCKRPWDARVIDASRAIRGGSDEASGPESRKKQGRPSRSLGRLRLPVVLKHTSKTCQALCKVLGELAGALQTCASSECPLMVSMHCPLFTSQSLQVRSLSLHHMQLNSRHNVKASSWVAGNTSSDAVVPGKIKLCKEARAIPHNDMDPTSGDIHSTTILLRY